MYTPSDVQKDDSYSARGRVAALYMARLSVGGIASCNRVQQLSRSLTRTDLAKMPNLRLKPALILSVSYVQLFCRLISEFIDIIACISSARRPALLRDAYTKRPTTSIRQNKSPLVTANGAGPIGAASVVGRTSRRSVGVIYRRSHRLRLRQTPPRPRDNVERPGRFLWSMTWSTRALPAIKPEATAIGIIARWPLEITITFDGRRFCVPKFRHSTLQQTTRHW